MDLSRCSAERPAPSDDLDLDLELAAAAGGAVWCVGRHDDDYI